MQPCDSDPVAQLEVSHSLAQSHHDAGAFVTGDKGQRRFDRPVALGGVQVSVANTAGNDLHQGLSRTRDWHGNFASDKRLAELFNYRRPHCSGNRHDCYLS